MFMMEESLVCNGGVVEKEDKTTNVYVCDALPGKGKTTACINMMNAGDDKYIFVTQYLSEVERIKKGCKDKNFVSPKPRIYVDKDDRGITKLADVYKLMGNKENIATTHALFVNCTDEMKRLIRENEYVLVLDEVIDIVAMSSLSKSDYNVLVQSGTLREDDLGVLTWERDEYQKDGLFYKEMAKAKSKNFFKYDDDCFFWALPPDLFSCFKKVYVLTYLFKGQPLRCFFDMYGITYETIGVRKVGNNYEFCDGFGDKEDRAVELRDKIHILENDRVNEVGEKATALSYSWYRAERDYYKNDDNNGLNILQDQLYNVFHNIFKANSGEIMWTCYKEFRERLKGKGYSKGFLTYNKRASNEYADRKYLAYCVNNYPRPWEAKFYKDRGVTLYTNVYALTILVQWMFRSALRNGKEIWLWVPSRRMRGMLKYWLDLLADGNDLSIVDDDVQQNIRAKKISKENKKTYKKKNKTKEKKINFCKKGEKNEET